MWSMRLKYFSFFCVFFQLLVFKNNASNENNELQKLKLEKQLVEQKLSIIDSLLSVQLKVNQSASDLFLDSLLVDSLQKLNEIKLDKRGFPVNPFNDTLFYIYTSIGSFTAKERAAAINNKITNLVKDPFFKIDSLTIHKRLTDYEILYKNDLSILTVTPIDASLLKINQEVLVSRYLSTIEAEIENERQQHSLGQLFIRIGWAALIIFGLVLLIRFVNLLLKKVNAKLLSNEIGLENKFPLRHFKSITGIHFKTFISKVIIVFRLVLVLILIVVALTLLFNIFPITKIFTRTIIGWVLDPTKAIYKAVLDYLPNLFTILVIIFFFKYLIRLIRFFAVEINNKRIKVDGFYSDWAMTTFNIIRFLLIAFSFVIIFPFLPGSQSVAFQGVSVFIGLVVSFGSSTAISNMVAGIVLTYMRAFKIGDQIKIGEVIGDVIEKTALVTRIRTIKNEEITVPNANILTTNTINYSSNTGPGQKGLILNTTVTIGYNVPWNEIHDALINAALRTAFVLNDPKPFVFQTALNDFNVSYQINVYTHNANKQFEIYSELHKNIQDCCNEAGIEILSPRYQAVRDGNAMAIPENYLSKSYKSPGFKVDLNKNDESLKP